MHFLGFNIQFVDVSNTNRFHRLSYKLNNSRYLLRLAYQIEFYKRKLSKNFLTRLNLELVSHFNRLTSTVVFSSIEKSNKIWSYIFQLEAVRSSNFSRIFLSSDKSVVISKETFTKMKLDYTISYRRYLFSLYISKLQLTLEKIIKSFNFEQLSSCYPYDMLLDDFIVEYKKHWFLLYNSLFFENNDKAFFKTPKVLSNFSNYGLNFFKNNLASLKNVNTLKKSYNQHEGSVYFVASQHGLVSF